ncbi:MAG: hypothetical protein ABI537_05665 [Casimicrobiaceae bacterium]
MRKLGILLTAVGIALAQFALSAQAVTCDIVIDRTGAVVYQDVVPPVDMSWRGTAARDRMHQRGEQLMIIETSQCPKLVFYTVSGAASVDEIVSGMRPYVGANGGMGVSARPDGAAASSRFPAQPITRSY